MVAHRSTIINVISSTSDNELLEIDNRVKPLGYEARKYTVTDYDFRDPDEFDDYSDFRQHRRFIRYQMQIQTKIANLLKLSDEDLTICLEPLRGHTDEDDMTNIARLYL